MKYKVEITETLKKIVEVEADNVKDANVRAVANYMEAKEEYILNADCITETVFKIIL